MFWKQEPVAVEYFESFSHPETNFVLSSDVTLDFISELKFYQTSVYTEV